MPRTEIKSLITRLGQKMFKDDIFTRAAAMAFYSVLALAPLLMIFVWALGAVDDDLKQQVTLQIRESISPALADLARALISDARVRADLRTVSGWAGLAAFLVAVMTLALHLQASLRLIFHTSPPPIRHNHALVKFFRQVLDQVLLLGLVLVFVLIVATSFVLSAFIHNWISPDHRFWLRLLNLILNVFVFTLLFTVGFRWAQPRHISPATSWIGGFVTAIFFLIGKSLNGLYFDLAALKSAFGAASSLAILIIWIYYSSLIVFIGAETTYVLSTRERSTA